MQKIWAPIAAFVLAAAAALSFGCGTGSTVPQPSPPTPSLHRLTLVSPAPTVPSGTVGEVFSLNLLQFVQGGTVPITWSIRSGTLPAGLSLNSTSYVSGVPVASSTSAVVVFVATDSGNPPIQLSVSISLTINPGIITITPGSGVLSQGEVSIPYGRPFCRIGPASINSPNCPTGVSLTATGGVGPYTWSLAGSSLPPGLSLVTRGPPFGTYIGGIPTTPGTYSLVVTVTDAESPPSQTSTNYTITIAPAPTSTPP